VHARIFDGEIEELKRRLVRWEASSCFDDFP